MFPCASFLKFVGSWFGSVLLVSFEEEIVLVTASYAEFAVLLMLSVVDGWWDIALDLECFLTCFVSDYLAMPSEELSWYLVYLDLV